MQNALANQPLKCTGDFLSSRCTYKRINCTILLQCAQCMHLPFKYALVALVYNSTCRPSTIFQTKMLRINCVLIAQYCSNVLSACTCLSNTLSLYLCTCTCRPSTIFQTKMLDSIFFFPRLMSFTSFDRFTIIYIVVQQ